jgi:hypothetical protein
MCVYLQESRVGMIRNRKEPFMRSTEKLMPRQRDHDEQKDRHNIMASSIAWEGLEKLAKKFGYRSRSQLIESIGREELLLTKIFDEVDTENIEDK